MRRQDFSTSTTARMLAAAMILCAGTAAAFAPEAASRRLPLPATTAAYSSTRTSMSSDDTNNRPGRGRKRRALRKQIEKIFEAIEEEEEEEDDDDDDDDDSDERSAPMTDEQKASKIFDKIDIDSDGILTRAELAESGLQVGALGQIDVNRDGSISREEFQRAVKLLEGRLDGSSSAPDGQQAIVDELEDTLGELEPLERQELRLGGFEPYILVSVLTSQAAFDQIGDIDVKWDKIIHTSSIMDFAKTDWYEFGKLASAAGATVTGLYATVVFSLTILYGKTAMGMDRDDDYYGFMDNTGLQRFRAFQAFTTSLFLFCVTVLLSVCAKVPEFARLPLAAASGYFLYFAKSEYEVIMAAAAPMFAPKKSPKKPKEEEATNEEAELQTNGATDSIVNENEGNDEEDLPKPDITECYLEKYDGETCE